LLDGSPKPVRACQLKGRRNYLCLKQFDSLRSSPEMSDAEALLASRLLIWLCETETGDRAELRLTPAEEALWPRVSADGDRCTTANSPYMVDNSCFLQRARREAEAAHIVVVNHALLLSDVATEGHVLPPYEHLVVDEAHHLEEEATRQFGFTSGERRLGGLLERCEDLAPSLQKALRGALAALGPYNELTEAVRALRQKAGAARTRLKEFGERCSGFIRDHTAEPGEHDQRLPVNRGMRVQPDWPAVEMAWENLRLTLTELPPQLEGLLTALGGAGEFGIMNLELIMAEAGDLLGELNAAIAGCSAAIEEDDPQKVVWLERDRADGSIVLSWVPLTVDDLLRERLFAEPASVVLTGATLRSQGSFAFMQERLGLEDAETLALGSPFDYRRAALVLLPQDMPEPSEPDYLQALSQSVIDLARAAQGRALVLFTSHSSLRAVHTLVQPALGGEGINVLGQGIDGSPRQMVRGLQSSPNTVLLGTASFWEGVDIAGEALSLLVMARLPFAVPTEPVFAARSALYDDPFGQYALPQAILRFRQGFGRLIRSKTDRGVLAVLDRRILSKSYGPDFVEALPGCTVRQAMLREMPDLVEGWLQARVPA
jgi:DNA polymerase-3 subunit epsilon/ATP-dependent DNA helicase DinG